MNKNIKSVYFIILLTLTAVLSVHFLIHYDARVFLVGDSTMADKTLADNPERGWGQMLPLYFGQNVYIENDAKNGRSTKSFIDQGRWEKVYNELRPGDFVLIQFGHNDEKKYDTSRYTDPNMSFKNNLLMFVKQSREKGAVPVLITPVNRRKFDDAGKLIDTHGEYTQAVREAAAEVKAPLIDLYNSSKKLFNKLGPEGTKEIFDWVPEGEYAAKPDGKEDNTHFQQNGAVKIAGLVVNGIKKLNLSLSDFLLPDDSVKDIIVNGGGKVVGLDYYYNDEHKRNKDGKEVQYHYIWEDLANSGYSKLGKILTALDARVSAVKKSPAPNILNKLSIYMIVDPDTTTENPNPNYIQPEAVKNIVDWVKSGGVLILLANDKGNCEFNHLNKLSENFGIKFNGDSQNRVTGRNFDMGKFDKFPDHPIFKNVKQIYLKEISTLTLSKGAKAVLTDRGDVIMASSVFGKGFVFAVGDPWLYNEYIDNNKLPEPFENYMAARNLFYWLLSKSQKPVYKK